MNELEKLYSDTLTQILVRAETYLPEKEYFIFASDLELLINTAVELKVQEIGKLLEGKKID